MVDPIKSLTLALPKAIRQDRNPWNWCLRRLGVAALVLTLGLKSYLLFAAGIITLATSFFELHLSEMKNRLIWQLMRQERKWLDAPWHRRKRVQAASMLLFSLLLLWSLATGDLALILLAVAGAVMLWVEASQHALTATDDEDEREEEE